ncbi:FecCD family ABC transporter permease [Subtercola endophyticus]|uniref:FecCD family ABC transporter permease n=1 Tax=Subtercola endophyticus TaxID=2895559 RepID=UPI001E321C25|nr:iron ABC transporter permease [Subtercola endophyticus]UFS58944.1 iron ABC transporter permease [Subtercola endophyticus]
MLPKCSGAQRHLRRRRALLFAGLGVALVVVVVVSAATGQLSIPPDQVLGSILHALGISSGPAPASGVGREALWSIRFPRIALAMVVGAALSVSGMLMQAIFGNPLADPGVVGVSAGAAVGAAATIVLGWSFAGDWTIALTAFTAGLIATFLVYATARAGGKTEVVTLILTGVAVTAVAGAALAFLLFFGDTQAREEIVFWQLGSLNGAMWRDVWVVLPVALLGIVFALVLSRRLDLLSLGERSARHLGVNVELLRVATIILVALLVAVAVAFTGIIAFVGLVIPHLMRMIIGPAHLPLTIASALGGALLLSTADLAARTLVPYADLPIGMLTALVGGPFFFWLLRRTRAKSGGWA